MRRCSNCDKIGHTKKVCRIPVKISETVKEKVSEPVEEVEIHHPEEILPKKDSEKPVIVRVIQNAPSSPHVLHLKKENHHKFWKNAPFFQEKKHENKNRIPVDLAALVRESNKNQKEYLNKKSAAAYFSTMPEFQKPVFAAREKEQKPEEMVQAISIPTTTERKKFSFGDFFSRRVLITATLLFLCIAIPYPAFAYYKKLKNTSATLIEESTHGFLALQSSTVSALHANIPDAEQNLNHALESFAKAESVLDGEHQALQYIASLLPYVGTQIESRRHILNAGQQVALGNTYLLRGIETAASANESYLTDRLGQLKEHLRFALPQYRQALTELASVDNSVIPNEYLSSFQDFKILFTAFVNDSQNMIDFIDTMQSVFGGNDFKRYLIVFQNNRELRPTGGFMGSFAVLDVQKGKILSLTVPPGGTYDLKGQLDVHLKPPTPFLLVNSRWEFQDSNWWPDFESSAKKMAWFYQHGRGTTVDGVIAVNATVFESLISAIGPINNPTHNITLTAENALDDLQYKVEMDYDTVSNTPKAIIGDILGQLVSEIPKRNTAEALKILVALHGALAEKEIQAYFVDPEIQKNIESFGWSGKVLNQEKNQDYLFVVNTNIKGQKSDAKINQVIEQQSEVQEDGSVIDTVVVRRTHMGTPGEIFTGSPNISYLRVYVPEGAVLLDAGGFSTIRDGAFRSPELWAQDDIDLLKNEVGEHFDSKTGVSISRSFNKTVFANWVITNPGESSEIFLSYRIPALVNMQESPETTPERWETIFFGEKPHQASRYSLLVQKQSGVDSDFVSTVIYPKTWHPVWRSNESVDLAMNGAVYKTKLDKDLFYGLVMEK